MIKMSITERAKQFGAFSPLRGYDDLIESKKFIAGQKKELTEEHANELSKTVAKIKKGDIVEVTFYKKDGYVVKEGAVSGIDCTLHTITVVKEHISFSDIWDIKITGEL